MYVLALALVPSLPASDPPALHFRRIELSSAFTCEGAAFADLDRDGHVDVVAGPYWYAGPGFEQRRELYSPREFDPLQYSDAFFAWAHDHDDDGWTDVTVVGFPGQGASWLENPGEPRAADAHWERHPMHPSVDNESPAWGDVDGDGRPELVFHTGGRFGYGQADRGDPRAPWTFHAISEERPVGPFVHGLGIGDVNGDGRVDVLEKDGWYEHPRPRATGAPPTRWRHHPVDFAAGRRGGAQMLVHDVDGDGDGDVVTSLDAHGWGLSWFENVREEGETRFVEHRVQDAEEGFAFSQLHALALADFDGDGIDDVVTGKRYWAHGPGGDPMPNAPPVVAVFLTRRAEDGSATLVPRTIDFDSGVGVQVAAGDVDGDGRADVVTANKRGAFVLLQRAPGRRPRAADGRSLNLGFETGDLSDWTAVGDAFEGQPIRGDTSLPRCGAPSLHQGEYWVGGYELHGDGREGFLISDPFVADAPFLSMLIGGGANRGTRADLFVVGEDEPFFTTSGPSYESLQRVVVELGERQGAELQVHLADTWDGSWGHVNFDDVLLHDEEPVFHRPSHVPPILRPDPPVPAGLSPGEAVAAMTVPDGFRVELIAAEPDLHQPIAMTVDAKGRIWIAEAYAYPVRRPDGEGEDTILVFEDRDLDGSYETRTVFADDLNLVSGLEVGFGGVWVGAAPYLYFIPDRDDDLVPDGPPEVLLDGWGYEDTHETLNAFIWGPDGWLYGCHGVFTHSRVGAPGTPDDERTPMNAGVWRYHPTRHEFEVFAWGTSNPWGLDFDQHGQAFITACVIPHLFHVVQGGRYHRQAGSHFNPYVYEDIQTIADHLHWQGESPWAGNAHSDAVGGGHAHCGALIYQGPSFPEEYRGQVLFANIHGNRLNRDSFAREGSSFVASHQEDFLLANDAWFRGIAMKQLPGGSIVICDWYDPRACHSNDVDTWNRTNGRLYRVSYGEPPRKRIGIAAALAGDDEWLARRTQLLLQERGGDEDTARALRAMYETSDDPTVRLRALWSLHVTTGISSELGTYLTDPSEYVRGWAVQLAGERGVDDMLAEAFLRRADVEESPLVRAYLASALQRMPADGRRLELAERLTRAGDDTDPNLPHLLWYGVEPMVVPEFEEALDLARRTPLESLSRKILRRAAEEWSLHGALVTALATSGDTGFGSRVLEELDRALSSQRDVPMPAGWPAVYRRLTSEGDATTRERATALAVAFGDSTAFPELRSVLADGGADIERRRAALDALVQGEDVEGVGAMYVALGDSRLRGETIRALAAFDAPATPGLMIEVYAALSTDERRDALNTLASRPSFASTLLDAVDAGKVPREHLGAFVLRQLRNLGDPEIDARITETWGTVNYNDEGLRARIDELKDVLSDEQLAAADLPNGRDVFARTCEQCHVLFDPVHGGGDVGPELTGSNRGDLDYLLENLVAPSAVVGLDYQATIAWLRDGRVVTGILREETDSAVTLRTENDLVVLPRDDIEELRPSELSTMPNGLLDALGEDEVRDLVAYMRSPAQVPRRATPANAQELFDGETLTGWTGDPALWSVEDGALVGRTDGLEHNAFLRSHLELRDFRLTLEVLLVDDRGNSGIQFRSRVLAAGDVAGYQADVGAGWWGKLYEEHGRGLLVEPGATNVRAGDWNEYEILASGARIRLSVNGEVCAELDDPEAPAGADAGILALQIHSGGPTEVRFRNFQLEVHPR